ncbi:MAG TPA: hypothetical protein VNU26_05820 [Mycobacteriales bacterium]|nr:hypothetical protein [Mycobacteriales bacterium]
MSDEQTTGQSPATGGPGEASAGVPSGAAPSGALSAGHVPEDARDDVVVAEAGPQGGGEGARALPGTPPGPAVSPVPAPGAAPGVSVPGVQAAQAASPEDGIPAGDKTPGSDASVSSPGAWTALAVPGKPDGEVDTRAR